MIWGWGTKRVGVVKTAYQRQKNTFLGMFVSRDRRLTSRMSVSRVYQKSSGITEKELSYERVTT